ncbi:MAG TPA: hypothetical protein VHK47_23635, partial [Polyangia bacterium]|nr:hypothetical protein [Polyangia bacterium]
MKRALLGFGLVALGLACTEKGRSLLLVDVSNAPTAPAVDSVTVEVIRGSDRLISHDEDWTGSPTLKLGLYLSKDVSGDVQVVACGYDRGTLVAVGGPKTATVQPGETTNPTELTLMGGTSSLCAHSDASGAGGNDGAAG